jgi:hypothetical protein
MSLLLPPLLLAAPILLPPRSRSHHGDVGVSIVPVFSRGEGGCSAFRIPGIASLNGTLLAFAECRKYSCADFGGQHNIVHKRSTDGGSTFGEMVTLLDPLKMFPPSECPPDASSVRSQNHSCQFWDPTPIVDRISGVIFLLATRSWAHDGLTALESRDNSFGDMWVLSSSDLGRTWAAPRNITAQVWSSTQHLPAMNNGHGMQTSTGRLIAPACARPDAMDPVQHMHEHSAIVYSDDGQRWHFANTSLVGPGTTESEVVQLQHRPDTLMYVRCRPMHACGALTVLCGAGSTIAISISVGPLTRVITSVAGSHIPVMMGSAGKDLDLSHSCQTQDARAASRRGPSARHCCSLTTLRVRWA